jgi:GMP reductase
MVKDARMRIESEIKLDYKDVLMRPKRSTLESRNDVDLVREFTFPNAGGEGADPKAYSWKGVPIVASNMDTVGTFEMAKKHIKNSPRAISAGFLSVDK